MKWKASCCNDGLNNHSANRSHTKAPTEERVNCFVQQWHGAKILVCNLANSSGAGIKHSMLWKNPTMIQMASVLFSSAKTWSQEIASDGRNKRQQLAKHITLSKSKMQRNLARRLQNRERGKRKCSDWSVAQTPRTKTCWSADARLEAARTMRWQSAGSGVSWISRAAPKQRPAEDGSTLPEGATTSPVAVRTIGALEAGWLIITGSPAVERESTLSNLHVSRLNRLPNTRKWNLGPTVNGTRS